ncbi:hypothetical protein [Lactobacillus iners]|nr:hypothetical protein [Lactobacillus iners]MCT7671571.1 hypothetical protein [Lactobacillus iners]MCT7677531.1 hypothetical protein [Lactobacillus iners]MCT7682762.1 hypothetical protein [Lactobacillus iners]MCT7693940.1 hypothetical protein [Lactobacillus iners]MCT7811132.1 hypothetical protein [Lactobacillus iners]
MRKKNNKKDDQLVKLALATATLGLLEKLIELVIQIIKIIEGK